MRDPLSKNANQRQPYSQLERGIYNQVDNIRNIIYRCLLQSWIPRDKYYDGKGKGELITFYHCPSI